jgi:hypothetical protein
VEVMANDKHTPSPWTVQRGINDWDILVGNARLAGYIEREANARLIAAAPDLLDALILAVATIRAWHGMGMGPAEPNAWFLYQDSPEMKFINAAIVKAGA